MIPNYITADDYYSKSQPAKTEEVVNVVEITTKPLAPAAVAAEIYRSNEAISISAGGTVSIDMKYTEAPVIEAVASFDEYGTLDLEITSATYYAWGATIRVREKSGTAGTFKIVVSGKKLSVNGGQVVTEQDETSIARYGVQKYTYPGNHLIQSKAVAQKIAAALLLSYKNFRKDVNVDWRGNPADYTKQGLYSEGLFYIYKNKIDFDGVLRQKTDGRRLY
jgi:hypothetical protein